MIKAVFRDDLDGKSGMHR